MPDYENLELREDPPDDEPEAHRHLRLLALIGLTLAVGLVLLTRSGAHV